MVKPCAEDCTPNCDWSEWPWSMIRVEDWLFTWPPPQLLDRSSTLICCPRRTHTREPSSALVRLTDRPFQVCGCWQNRFQLLFQSLLWPLPGLAKAAAGVEASATPAASAPITRRPFIALPPENGES